MSTPAGKALFQMMRRKGKRDVGKLRQRDLHVNSGGVDTPVAQEVRNFIDGLPLPNQMRRQAMAHQMGTGNSGKLDPALLQL